MLLMWPCVAFQQNPMLAAAILYQVGVANQLQLQRDELLEVLRSSGSAVLDSPADQVATRTIKTYLDLKRRLRL